jgi:hypothetical protein
MNFAARSAGTNSTSPMPQRRFQFGILHLLIVTTLVAVMLWAVPWFESAPWVAIWVNLLIGAVFAGLGVYMSATMLGLMLTAARDLFRVSGASLSAKLWIFWAYFLGFVLILLITISLPFDAFVEHADALGSLGGWLIIGGGIVGLIAFAAALLLPRSKRR